MDYKMHEFEKRTLTAPVYASVPFLQTTSDRPELAPVAEEVPN